MGKRSAVGQAVVLDRRACLLGDVNSASDSSKGRRMTKNVVSPYPTQFRDNRRVNENYAIQ